MSDMNEIKAIVRIECLDGLVHALEDARAARVFVSRVHALGAGADPRDLRSSLDEGSMYTEKARVEVLCPAEGTEELVSLVLSHARTGHRGDGIVVVTTPSEVVNVRTGDRGALALV